MLTGNWIYSGPLNQLFVVIEGKSVPLRITVFQHRAYTAYLESRKKAAKEAEEAVKETKKPKPGREVADVVREMSVDALDIAVIALNPEEGKMDFSPEKVADQFDIDQLMILAKEWQDRKIFAPQLKRENDPLMPAGGAK